MKLHLPSILRAALLTCFAATSSFTISVATGTLAAGIVTCVLSQQQVEATDYLYVGGNIALTDPDGGTIATPNAGTADDKIVMDFTEGWITPDNAGDIQSAVYLRHVIIGGISQLRTVRFNNAVSNFGIEGSPTLTATREGEFTPNGGIYATANTNETNNIALHFIFEGAMKDFSGNIISTGSGIYLTFADYATGLSTEADRNESASGSGVIKIGGRAVNYNMTGTVTVNNTSITVSNTIDGNAVTADDGSALNPLLSFAGGATYNVGSIISADMLSVAAGTTSNFNAAVSSTTSQNILGTVSFAAMGNSLSGALTVAAGSSMSISAGATMTMNGTLTALSVINNAGTVTFGDDFIVNLSGMTAVGDTYTLFTNTGVGSLTGFNTLTAANIDAEFSTVGKDFVFNDDGTITVVATGNTHTFTGGNLEWEVNAIFSGGLDFVDGDSVIFTGDSDVSLVDPINAAGVTVSTDTTVELSSTDPAVNQLAATLFVDGTLVLQGDVLTDASQIISTDAAAAGTVQFDVGAGNTLNYQAQLADFTGEVQVSSGTLAFGDNATYAAAGYDITALAGGTIQLTNMNLTTAAITLTGSTTDASDKATLVAATGGTTGFNAQLTATGYSELVADSLIVVRAGITGSGTLTKSGTAILELISNSTHTGILDIVEGQVNLGNGDTATRTVAFERIILNDTATLRWQNGATPLNTLQMNGGTFYVQDMNLGVTNIAKMEVTADSAITQIWNSSFFVKELTGTANLNFDQGNNGGDADVMRFEVGTIRDYQGTIDLGADPARRDFVLNTVDQSVGNHVIIQNAGERIVGNNVVVRGEGNLTITEILATDSFQQIGTGTTALTALSINNNGTLHMNYNGTLTAADGVGALDLQLANNAKLMYGGEGANLFNILSEDLMTADATLTAVLINLDQATLETGILTGISKDIAEAQIEVFGLRADQYSLVAEGDVWKLTVNAGEVFDFGGWDTDWGIDVLLTAPSMDEIVATDAITASTALALPVGTSDYLVAGTNDIAVNLTGGGGDAVFIYGGTNSNTTQTSITANVWINMTGGDFRALVGGNLADNWGGGTVCNFVGDTHIQVSGGTVDHIIGGNYKDGTYPTFTGNSYITIDDGAVIAGSIIGAGTVTHQDATTFNGSTNIFINTVLASNDGAALHSEGALHSIVGSNAWYHNGGAAMTHTGASNVTIDLSATTSAETSFVKRVIGGAFVSNSTSSTMNGDSNVSITGKDGVTFDTDHNVGIMGSYYNNGSSTVNHNGSSHMTITGSGSTFADRVVAGAEHVGSTGSITEGSFLTIHGGTFSSHVMGGSNVHNGVFSTGGTNLTISDGTFNGFVFGGSVHAAGTYSNTAGTEVSISGGTFITNVFGGSINVNNAGTNTTQGKVNMLLTGGTFNTYIAGGSSIDAAFTGTASVAGGVEITVDDMASMGGNIIGGHVRLSGTTECNLSMGDVVINLAGGTVGADVHAAGFLGAVFDTTTASTKVTIDNDVVFDNTADVPTIINGGFGGAGAAGGSVTGTRSLSFSATDAYGNLDNVTYQNFDVVEVVDANVSVGITLNALELTKTGAGSLELSSANRDLVTVEEGTLKLGAGASTITELNVLSTASLDLTNGAVGKISDLTLQGLSGLTANNSGTGQALDSLTLTGVNATNKVALDLGTLNPTFDVTLFTGLSDATITGIDFVTTGSFVNANALEYFDIAGLGAGATAFLLLDGDTLRLVNSLVAEMTWGGGSGSINAANWVVEGARDQNFANELSYTFDTAETADIVINVAVEAASFNVTGENVVYNFTEDATGSLVTTALSVTGGATASFDMANLDLTGSSVTIGANSTLILEQEQTINSLNSSGTLEAIASAITLSELTTSGGTVSAGSLSLANGENSFAQLTITGDVNSAGSLTVGGISSLGGLTGDGSLNVTGAASSLTVTDADATTLAGFSNEGSVTFTGNLTVASEITDGATLSVADLTLTGGAQFDKLTAANVSNTTGTLSLGGESSMTSLTGSAALVVRTGGDVTITNATTLASLSNAGELEVNAALSILGSTTTGGTLSATDLTLSADANGEHSFTKLTVTGNVLGHDGTLTLADGSSISGNLNGGALVTSGAVSIGSNNAGMRSLNNAGTLTMGGNLLVGNDGLINTGTLDVTGTATLFIATDQGGVLEATGNVTLAGASNTFTSINTDGVIQGTDTLVVSESSSAGTLYKTAAGAGVEQLDMALQFTNTAAGMTLSTTEDVRLSSVTGGGSLSVANSSNLVLVSASNMNNLTLGTGSAATSSSLTLGGGLSLAGQLHTTENLHLVANFSPTGGNAALSAGSTAANTLSSIEVWITGANLDNMGLGNNSSYELVSLGAGYATDVTVTFDDTLEGVTAGDLTSLVSGSNTYTISYDAVRDTVVISNIVVGNTWQGADMASWDDSTTANWSRNMMPTAATEAFFFDKAGVTNDIVVDGTKSVANLEVSTSTAFIFSGDGIQAQELRVTEGTMSIGNAITVVGGAEYTSGTTLVSTNAGIDISTGGSLSTTMLDIRENAALFDGTIAGIRLDTDSSLTVEEGSTTLSAIENAGTITLNGDAADGIYEHDISSIVGMDTGLAGQDIMGNLVLGEQAEVSIDDLEQAKLTIGDFATLQINNDATITGDISNVGFIDASKATVTVGGSVTAGGDMDVMDFIVEDSGAVFGDVALDTLSITSALTADNAEAYLYADSLSVLNATSTTFTLSLDGMREDLEVGNYTLVNSNSNALNWDMVVLDTFTAETLTDLIYNGYDVVYDDANGDLSFEVTEATERRWMVSNNYAATAGFEPGDTPENIITPIVEAGSEAYDTEGNLISGKLNEYSTLDTVKQIFVDVDFTLDLSDLSLTAGDSDGALMRDVSGSATLTLVGKGSEGNVDAISLATLDSSTVNMLTGLSLDKMLVRFTENAGHGNMQIGTLDLLNSAIEVKAGASLAVTGTTTLDASSLSVGEGAGALSPVGSTANLATVVLKNGSSLLVNKTDLIARNSNPVDLTVGTLQIDATSSHETQEGAVSMVSKLEANGGTVSAATDAHSYYQTAEINGAMEITTTGSGVVEIGSITASVLDADGKEVQVSDTSATTLNGYLKLGNGIYEGSYVDGSTIETAVGGNTTLNTGAGLHVVTKGAAYVKLADSGDNSVKSMNTVGAFIEVESQGLNILESSTMQGGTLAFSTSSDQVIAAMKNGSSIEMLAAGSSLTTNGTTILVKQSDTAAVLDFGDIDMTKEYTIADFNLEAGSSVGGFIWEGSAFSKYIGSSTYDEGTSSLTIEFNKDAYGDKAMTPNGRAGADLLSSALLVINPQLVDVTTGLSKSPDLKGVLDAMDSLGGESADALAAAVAGSSVTSLGSSMLASVDRQIQNVRNRTTSMGGSTHDLEDGPLFNAWIVGEGSYNKLDADGTAAGHNFSSYGGSFGVDAEFSDMFSFGLAATALYGSVDSSAPDIATGDLNTYSLSAYAVITSKRWNHTFVASASMADAHLDRTVNYGAGSYSSEGDTDGYGFGLMYELGYTCMLSEDGSTAWQPLLNISFVNASVSGYTEEGSDASLVVGDQESSYVTLGLGARLETIIGESTFNRSAVLSLRSLLKLDAGDRYTSADVAFVDNAGTVREVEGAEVGAFGIEFGAGLSIPLGAESGTLFMDAGCEFREGQNNVNASMGYKFAF